VDAGPRVLPDRRGDLNRPPV